MYCGVVGNHYSMVGASSRWLSVGGVANYVWYMNV